MLYRNTFIDYGVIPTGWAYQDGFITDYSIKGTENATRGETAEYIYHMYEKYQEKYGLSVVNTSDMPYVSVCDDAMNTLFTHYGADSNNYENLTKAGFTTAMNNAFQDAKGLDLCYLYCASHGGTSGLALFSGSPTIMTPTFLRNQIDIYNGTFIVFVSGCHSGTYVSSEDGSDDLIYIEDEFDTDSFVEILTGTDDIYTVESDLRDGSRIKVLCSSRKEEVSYSTDKLATNYWCLGSGYNFRNNSYTSMYADSNTDGRISLEELYLYSYEKIQNSVSQQHVIRYPYNDPIIIFENRF